MDIKKELRREFSAKRKAAKNQIKDDIITARVLSLDRLTNADVVLLYASFGSEVNTWSLADKLTKKNIPIAFPKCSDNGIMSFHRVKDISDLCDNADGKFGICEPDESLPEPEITERTVCILPGLAFTENGCRLGYGGGYYDRFLSAHPQVYAIALSYEDNIADDLPQGEHDIKINVIVTEERLVLCNV